MNKILKFKKIVSIGFFAAFLAVFLSAGSAQASFWDWLNLNKSNNNSQQQQAAAIANADTTSSSSSASVTLTAKTGAADNVTSNSARLKGSINPKGENVSVYFKYRKNSESSGATKTTSWMSAGSISSDFAADIKISNLSSGTTYVYRFYAYNYTTGKTIQGDLKSFTTLKDSSSSSSVQSSSSVSSGASSSSSSSAQQYTLKVKISGAGKIMSNPTNIDCKKDSSGSSSGTCSIKVNKDESITLDASPNPSYEFGVWGDACRGKGSSQTCVVKMGSDKTVSATFNAKGKTGENIVTVSVRKTGAGVGKVVSIISAGKNSGKEDGAINCGSNCSQNYKQYCENSVEGDRRCGTAYFKAIAEKGSTFSGWGGDCLTFKGVKDQCYVVLDGAKTINANFNEGSGNTEGKYFDLTVTVSAGGTVATTDNKISCDSSSSPCKHSYGKNGTVTLKVTPNSGYTLGDYSGCSKSGNVQNGVLTCKVKMTQNRNVKINFKASGTTSSSSSSKSSSSASANHTATTGSATNVTSTSATLNGTVNPKGENVNYIFSYYKSGTGTSVKNTSWKSAGSGSSDVSVSANISGLSSGTTYYYYINAYSYTTKKYVGGSTAGIKSFTTSGNSSSSSVASGSASVDLKAREVKTGSAFGDYADSLTLNNANSGGNESIDLKWTVSGVSSCSLSYDSNAKQLRSSVSSSDLIVSSGDTRHNTEDYVVNSSSRQTATYTLTCEDSSGNSKSDSVSVTY